MGISEADSFSEVYEVKPEMGDGNSSIAAVPLAIGIPAKGEGLGFGVPQPLDCLQGSPVPPFLSKTYDLVDDPGLDGIISWGASGQSFVVWNPIDFSRVVLPRNFKHNNFSSFVRQLNTYRFRKIDADKWEFANKGFVRGNKHLLKSIQRRKSPQVQQGIGFGGSLEEGGPGFEDELNRLREERIVLRHEVSELQIEQDGMAHLMELVNQRIQVAERKQKQMATFLFKLFQNPAFLARLQTKKDHNQIESPNNKRKFITQTPGVAGMSVPNVEKKIAKFLPDPSSLSEPTIMLDSKSVSTPELPGYFLDDFVGKLGADPEPPPSNELAALEGFVASPEDMGYAFESSNNIDSVFKGKGKANTHPDFNPKYLVSFPEGTSMGKGYRGLSTSRTQSLHDNAWNMGFDASILASTPGNGLWDSSSDYNVPELGVSSLFSGAWEFASPHADEWTFDEHDVQVEQTEDDVAKYMDH